MCKRHIVFRESAVFRYTGAKPYQEGLSCIKPLQPSYVCAYSPAANQMKNANKQTPFSSRGQSCQTGKPPYKRGKTEKQKAEPRYYINPKSFSVEKMDEQKEKKPIALVTIDDAPDQHAAEIADKLHDLNASAIFCKRTFLKKMKIRKRLSIFMS